MMDHNEFDFIDDLVQPYFSFLRQLGIEIERGPQESQEFKFPEYLYIPPQSQLDAESAKMNSVSLWYWFLKQLK